MSFQNVDIGSDQAVDLDTINKFALNDNYLQDMLQPAPRGIIAWKTKNLPITIPYNQSLQQPISGLSLTFNAEENRFYSFDIGWGCGGCTGSGTFSVGYAMRIDNKDINTFYSGIYDTSKTSFDGVFMSFIPETVVSAGSHVIQFAANCNTSGSTYTMRAGSVATTVQMWVRDHGAWVEPS